MPVLILATAPAFALAPASVNQATPTPDKLPEAPGKAVLTRMCTSCHGTEVITDAPRTVPVWVDTVLSMKDFGADGSDEDWKAVTDYLIVNLALLEVNKAKPEEIAPVLGLSEQAAAGVVAYRDKVGGFKTIGDLKQAPDVDAARIDALAARLMF